MLSPTNYLSQAVASWALVFFIDHEMTLRFFVFEVEFQQRLVVDR